MTSRCDNVQKQDPEVLAIFTSVLSEEPRAAITTVSASARSQRGMLLEAVWKNTYSDLRPAFSQRDSREDYHWTVRALFAVSEL
jgi:hypothetical protein